MSEITKPDGTPATPEAPTQNLSPVEQFILDFYGALNDHLRACLSAGIGVTGTLTQNKQGTLSLVIDTTVKVKGIDMVNKRVIVDNENKDSETSPVPDVGGNPVDGCGEGQACCGAKDGCGQSDQKTEG